MSRNLLSTICYFCNGPVVLEQTPHIVSPDECGPYFEEYQGMRVANARCKDCCALYLAWVTPPPGHGPIQYEGTHYDLSFRSTFDDEPGLADLPKFVIERKAVRVGLFDPRISYSYLLKDDDAQKKD